MRLPDTAHTSRPWRIHELTRDFRLEDVWALPTPGGPGDFPRLAQGFPRLVQGIASAGPSPGVSRLARALWAVRWRLGALLGWDDPDSGLGSRVSTLRDRLPADLRGAPSGPDLRRFSSLYLVEDEWAAEIANRTVHGVLHLGWVPDGTGGYRGQLAVLVKPNGVLGTAYLAAIKPLRHLIVYPALLRGIERAWPAPARRPTGRPDLTLPPGQRLLEGFPRFGTHLAQPAPAVPVDPVIEIRGAVAEPFALPLAALATLPRRELSADFHCVAGWSATNLHWEGVAFETLYRMVVEPSVRPGKPVTHVVFGGLDGYRSVVPVADALAGDVLIADRLDGRPLDADHGAPVRLVSPNQYGYVSTKHLCRIELHTTEPTGVHASLALRLLKPHPRARVWKEERHRYLPGWAVRPFYRLTSRPISFLSARGSRPG